MLDASLPPVRQQLEEDPRRFVGQYVASKEAAGLADEDMVYLSFTDQALGSPPYIICLHR